MRVSQAARARRAKQDGELTRVRHGVPQRGSYGTRARTESNRRILSQFSSLCQQNRKRRARSLGSLVATFILFTSHFLGRISTREEIAPFFSMPPTIIGPSAVFRIPPLSARASNVSSLIVSQRAPCSSKSNVTGDISASLPS